MQSKFAMQFMQPRAKSSCSREAPVLQVLMPVDPSTPKLFAITATLCSMFSMPPIGSAAHPADRSPLPPSNLYYSSIAPLCWLAHAHLRKGLTKKSPTLKNESIWLTSLLLQGYLTLKKLTSQARFSNCKLNELILKKRHLLPPLSPQVKFPSATGRQPN